jgi:hypothetical protein
LIDDAFVSSCLFRAQPCCAGFCAACHSFKVVGRQGMSRERWADTLGWMTEKHSMPKLEGADLDIILDYLAKVYPASQQPQGGWKNPFAK